MLEEDLLFPASTQVAVFVSMDIGTFFALDSVQLKVDDKEVANYLYTEREQEALKRGGVQRLWLGNLKAGEHEVTAFFTGQGPHERDYKRGTTLKVEKGVGAKYVELKISDKASQAPARVRGPASGSERGVLRRLLILAALAPAAPRRARRRAGRAFRACRPCKVQDLHYGDVLFHFYQQDHFDSLVRLAAYRDQGRLAAHARDAELLRGGLYLSLGQHREAREIFERLLADAATPAPTCATRPGSTSARCSMPPALFEESDRALRQSAGTLPRGLEAERRLLIAQGLLYRQRYDQAIAELSNWQGPRYWLAYGQFNLGVALVRAGEPERGLALLDSVGQHRDASGRS